MKGAIVVRPVQVRGVAQFVADAPPSVAGRRIRKFFPTEFEAEAWAMEHRVKAKEQGYAAFRPEVNGKALPAIVELYRVRRGRDAARQDRIEKGILDALAKKYAGIAMDAITPAELERWIWSRGKTETTKAKYFRYVRAFWNWSLKKGLASVDVIAGVDAPSADSSKNILTPAQIGELISMEAAPPWLVRYFVLGAFAGIRTEESLQLRWKHVRFRDKQIHVPPEIAKATGGFDERFTDWTDPLASAAKGWKKLAADEPEGLIVDAPYGTFRKAREWAALAAGLPGWPRNCLRHSFASYHLARDGNAAKTAFQMGHTSPAMVLKTYKRAVPAGDVRRWWALRP